MTTRGVQATAPGREADQARSQARCTPATTARPQVLVKGSAAVGSAQAQQWPRLSLSGSIGALRYSASGTDSDVTTWSLGPVALSVPLFDAGQRAANVDLAQANYAQSVVAYRAKVRQAVREVEESLVNLQSAQSRSADAARALGGYAHALELARLRYQQGMSSLVELEDARRASLAAESALASLELERQRAWVSLYRACGGGWDAQAARSTVVPPVALVAP
jgi:outer membrane protein TolC